MASRLTPIVEQLRASRAQAERQPTPEVVAPPPPVVVAAPFALSVLLRRRRRRPPISNVVLEMECGNWLVGLAFGIFFLF